MKRADLTQVQKQRLDKNNICPLCGKSITDFEDIKFTMVRYRRYKVYNFYHERCLINGEKIQEETTEERKDC